MPGAPEHVYRAALEARVDRLVLVSSFGAMGVAPLAAGAVVDEDAPLEAVPEARDAYSFAKQRQEALAWRFAREEGLPLAVVRPGFVFGPGQEILGTRIGLPLFGLFLNLGGRNLVPRRPRSDARSASWTTTCPRAPRCSGATAGR